MLWDEWAVRVVPPRGTGAVSNCRALACNNATTSQEIDNDIFQITGGTNPPGSYGEGLMRCHAEGNDIYIVFSVDGNALANSAATAANGQGCCDRIPAGQDREYLIHPGIDKFFSARTINGGTLTATLRYRITTEPKQRAQSGL